MARALRADIVILGAGNVATHLARALADHCRIVQIYNRRMAGAEELAAQVGAEAIDTIEAITPDALLYLIAVNDDSIATLAKAIGQLNIGNTGIWAHTSGSVAMDTLSPISSHHGVFYPMQTFSKAIPVDLSRVPIFIEGASPKVTDTLTNIATLISQRVYEADSRRRRQLHIAAVFACNFTNHLWDISTQLLNELGLDFDTMEPLIRATLSKALDCGAHAGQTGPARRGDTAVIASHVAMLNEAQRHLYTTLSQSILTTFNPNEQD